MEVKLQQQLVCMDQKPLYQIHLDLRKAYDALIRSVALKYWQGMVAGQICFAFRGNSRATRRWYDARVVIMVYLLRLIVELHRGGLFPASCSIFVSTVS
jgi:hypothetical protein